MNENLKQNLEKYFDSKIKEIKTDDNYFFEFIFENNNSLSASRFMLYEFSKRSYDDFCEFLKKGKKVE